MKQITIILFTTFFLLTSCGSEQDNSAWDNDNKDNDALGTSLHQNQDRGDVPDAWKFDPDNIDIEVEASEQDIDSLEKNLLIMGKLLYSQNGQQDPDPDLNVVMELLGTEFVVDGEREITKPVEEDLSFEFAETFTYGIDLSVRLTLMNGADILDEIIMPIPYETDSSNGTGGSRSLIIANR